MLRKFIDFITSLKLTIATLAAAIVLVFAGTLAQVHYGIHIVQERYFQILFVWWPPESAGWKIPVLPGGHLLGAVLLVNLIAAHIRRFKWTWRKFGIHLTHAGLIIMLAGGLFTDLFSVESHMRLTAGETKNYSEDPRLMELAVTDETNPEFDQVTAIPEARLRREGIIEHSSLPFRIVVRHFYQNSQLQMLDKATPGVKPAASQGVGAGIAVKELPRATSPDAHDAQSAVIEIVPQPGAGEITSASLGTWLVSDALGAPQGFSCAGTHERYAGTEIPKNFASSITLIDTERPVSRDVLIYMNHPLRYRGETFYQSGFDKNDTATILQVVRNPSFVAPYVACIVVAAGLLIQFSYHLVGFSRRKALIPAQ